MRLEGFKTNLYHQEPFHLIKDYCIQELNPFYGLDPKEQDERMNQMLGISLRKVYTDSSIDRYRWKLGLAKDKSKFNLVTSAIREMGSRFPFMDDYLEYIDSRGSHSGNGKPTKDNSDALSWLEFTFRELTKENRKGFFDLVEAQSFTAGDKFSESVRVWNSVAAREYRRIAES